MGLYIMDKPWTCCTTFLNSFFLVWMLSMVQSNMLTVALWPLYLGLFFIYMHKYQTQYDWGLANCWGRFMGKMMGTLPDGADWQELLFVMLMQFGGSFVGQLVYNIIFGGPVAPQPNPLGNTGKLFVWFLFANFVQGYAANRVIAKDTTFDNSFRMGAAYMFSWVLCQMAFPNSIGGVTIDFGRLLGSELTDSNLTNFDNFWVLIAAPFAGWGLAGCYQWLECSLLTKQSGETTAVSTPYPLFGGSPEAEPVAADNNAEENA